MPTARSYEIRSVTRALDVLTALCDLGQADLTTIARSTGLHPTTTLRMLESLRSRDFVRQQRGGGYQVGPRAFEVGSGFLRHVSLAEEAQALVGELAVTTGETASVGILEDGEVLYIAIARSERELGIQSTPGGRHPAHCTALGKALLAHLPWEDVEAIVDEHPLEKLTDTTIVTHAGLRRELLAIAKAGYAVDRQERVPGVVCIAAPIRDRTGTAIAAISISGPRIRLGPDRIEALAAQVVEAGAQASRALGALDEVPAGG